MHSLINNQLSSPHFKPMIMYSWFKSGYLSENSGKFQNVIETFFKFSELTCFESCSQCSEGVFLVCSWCKIPICFNHFFVNYHFCSNL